MCIICKNNRSKCFRFTSLFYNPYKNIEVLDVSNCTKLTSEILHSILNQCTSLKILCCSGCKSLTCLNLKENKNIETLHCSNCRSLVSIDLQDNKDLTILYCSGCISLISLDLQENKNLEEFWCYNCSSLIFISLLECKNLKQLLCNNCTSLTCILSYKKIKLEYKDFNNCPWICQNKDFSTNLQRLIKIQKWYRKLLLIKYMKSQEFVEWIYSPNNIGGCLYKKWLLKNLK